VPITDPDTILNILGNDTRRKILSALSKEPMYFNQLAKAIDVGQQAILRHLQALEDGGLIESYGEKSNLGAPQRKYYKLNSSFSMTISFSEDDFTITNQDIKQLRQKESRKYYKMYDSMSQDTLKALAQLQKNLDYVDEEIRRLESRLSDLRALKQMILRRLHEIGVHKFEGNERKVLYAIVIESPQSVAELSEILDEEETELREIIRTIREKLDLEQEHDSDLQRIFENFG
jgi:predicted transcriptional regulator